VSEYEVIIYWSDEDGAYIAEVPELPGCAADGTTYQEVLDNVLVIIQEWLETARELGRPIPKPKAIAQQKIDYQNLLQKWHKDTINTPGTVKELLAKREIVEPEPELQPEIIAKLHQLMAHKSQILKER